MTPLPIDAHLAAAVAAVRERRSLVLTAAPGAGKSTRIPPALLGAVTGQVLLLQPRRIAARSLARRIADEQGWQLGGEVGFQVRFEKIGGPATRLWVLTEGLLSRRLLSDPLLDGVGAVILDEFHERSIHTDLCLAHLAEVRRSLRPDLAVVVMSATLDPAPVAAFLDNAPVVQVAAPTYPVEIRHLPQDRQDRLEDRVAAAVDTALAAPDHGDVLVFLPGAGEIRHCAGRLGGLDAVVLPLHGGLPADEQDRAIRPDPDGRTRIVLATNVAETSLTIPGVRTVIDSGLVRIDRFDPDAGLDQLVTEPCSRASAAQRAGRAGRTAPGRCFKLWSQTEDARRPAATDPDVHRTDLAGTLLLLLKSWHGADARTFPWFDIPHLDRLQHGEDLLARLGAIAAPWGPLTARGQAMARLPVHPRLARLLLDARAQGAGALGAALAALLSGRDVALPYRRGDPPPDPGPADALDRLEKLVIAERQRFAPDLRSRGIDPGAAREAARVRDDLLRTIGAHGDDRDTGGALLATGGPAVVCRLLLAAFPDRVGRRAAPDANRGTLMGGTGVEIDPGSCLTAGRGQMREELFCAYAVQGLGDHPRVAMRSATMVRQGCVIDESDLEAVLPGSVRREDRLRYDDTLGRVTVLAGTFYGDLALRLTTGAQADPAAIADCLAAALAPRAGDLICRDDEARAVVDRWRWLRHVRPAADLQPLDDSALAEVVAAACAGCRTRDEVIAKPKAPLLLGRLTWQQQQSLDREAPSHLTVPTGNRIRLDYAEAAAAAARGETMPPILAVRLQELFGQAATPTIAGGTIGVLLHLLGPNYRVEQVTRDLASFWANTYPQVRKDLRGRYPKHSWPEDPLTAPPVAKGRPRG
jgi:ATP-dependent helicase HrpB